MFNIYDFFQISNDLDHIKYLEQQQAQQQQQNRVIVLTSNAQIQTDEIFISANVPSNQTVVTVQQNIYQQENKPLVIRPRRFQTQIRQQEIDDVQKPNPSDFIIQSVTNQPQTNIVNKQTQQMNKTYSQETVKEIEPIRQWSFSEDK